MMIEYPRSKKKLNAEFLEHVQLALNASGYAHRHDFTPQDIEAILLAAETVLNDKEWGYS